MSKLLLLLLAFVVLHDRLNAQCATVVNCPSDSVTIVCDESPNNTFYWNEPYWYDSLYSSQNLAEGSVDLPLFALDSCGTDSISVSYVLFLDLNGDGVRETAVTSADLPPAGTVYFNNAANPNYAGSTLRNFDSHPVIQSAKYRFGLEQTTSDDTLVARVRWFNQDAQDTINPQLPPGTHRIEWRMEQGGVVSTCQYNFTVRDCGLPIVHCQPGATVQILPSGNLELMLTDLLASGADNYSPPAQLVFGVREEGTGTGFPVDSAGSPLQSLAFTCENLGFHSLEVRVKDKAGLAGICFTYVILQDSTATCAPPLPTISEVCVQHFCGGQGVDEVTYAVQGNDPDLPPSPLFGNGETDSTGCVLLAVPQPVTAGTTFFALKDDNPLNGVTTFDLVLISRHILGLQALDSPYKIIAADANRSNSLTTSDIIELRKLILGIYAKLPNNTSWRFVNAGFVFPAPSNPFQAAFSEGRSWGEIIASSTADFYGLKIGDVNCSALTSVAAPAEERTLATLLLPDVELPAGAVVDIPLRLAAAEAWLGWQGSLVFDAQALAIEQVASVNLPGWSSDNHALLEGQINLSWSGAQPVTLLPGDDLLTIRLRTLRPVKLRTALALADPTKLGLRAEAYRANENPVHLALQFSASPALTAEENAIFAPQPNPTGAGARIPIRLAQAGTVTLELTDLTGRLLLCTTMLLDAGTQSLDLPAIAFPQAGLYGWRVKAGTMVRSGKVVRQ